MVKAWHNRAALAIFFHTRLSGCQIRPLSHNIAHSLHLLGGLGFVCASPAATLSADQSSTQKCVKSPEWFPSSSSVTGLGNQTYETSTCKMWDVNLKQMIYILRLKTPKKGQKTAQFLLIRKVWMLSYATKGTKGAKVNATKGWKWVQMLKRAINGTKGYRCWRGKRSHWDDGHWQVVQGSYCSNWANWPCQ